MTGYPVGNRLSQYRLNPHLDQFAPAEIATTNHHYLAAETVAVEALSPAPFPVPLQSCGECGRQAEHNHALLEIEAVRIEDHSIWLPHRLEKYLPARLQLCLHKTTEQFGPECHYEDETTKTDSKRLQDESVHVDHELEIRRSE